MGWFSADEIVAVDNSSTHDVIQSISIALLALAALAYGIFKLCNDIIKTSIVETAP